MVLSFRGRAVGLFVSGFLAASIMRVSALAGCVWGVWYGVVV